MSKASLIDIQSLNSELEGKNPRKILKYALSQFDHIGLSFSGAEDIVLIDMAYQIDSEILVFTLDTGRLHAETYRFLEKVRKHYHIELEILYPDSTSLEQFVKSKGLFSFYEDGHEECCKFRKIEPLRHRLKTLDAWITGQRKDQSQETRQSLPVVQKDSAFSTADHAIIKFNPLADWTSAKVWDYIDAYKLPYNELHERGYRSIGCEPCTRPTLPSQHERDGRWWFECQGCRAEKRQRIPP